MITLQKLNELELAIYYNTWTPRISRSFQGAGIRVLGQKPKEKLEGVIDVVSKDAKAISSLIFEMKEICSGSLDYLNKYEFYENIANAANLGIAQKMPLHELLISIIETVRIRFFRDETGLYFAYGSNMEKLRFLERCPDAIPIAVGKLPGYRFALDSAGTATVLPQDESVVYGLTWRISSEDELALDRYEGVSLDCYSKEHLSIDLPCECVKALVYVSLREEDQGKRRNGYLDGITNAAKELGLPIEYQNMLEEF